jgi:hypothetical protein
MDYFVTVVRNQLDEITFANASAEGRAMGIQQTIDYELPLSMNVWSYSLADSSGISGSWRPQLLRLVRISPLSNISWQISMELTARIILAQKTLAERRFAPIFSQYLASH